MTLIHASARRIAVAVVVSIAAVLPAPPLPAGDTAYTRGYLDALLDDRFPGLGLKVRSLTPDGAATLTARACLGPSQRRDIERLVLKTGGVKALVWDGSADCAWPPAAAEAGAASLDFRMLPEDELFAPLLADPRQPRFSMSYQRYKTPAQEFSAAGVAFGEYFGLATGFFGESGGSQIGIQGAVFALFNLDAASNDLVNADYWIGLPLSYRRGPWSFVTRVYHQSSHLGDEFILGNPGVNRMNLSYEDLEALVSYEWERWRLYGGGGYLLHSEPELARGHWQAGTEFVQPGVGGGLSLIAAADVQAWGELDWRRSGSFQAGFEFRNTNRRRVRLMFEHFRGHSPNGQFYRDRLRYSGVGVYFGF